MTLQECVKQWTEGKKIHHPWYPNSLIIVKGYLVDSLTHEYLQFIRVEWFSWDDWELIPANPVEPEVKSIDWTKPVKTRDGRPARIICTNKKSSCQLTIVALIDNGSSEVMADYGLNGKFRPIGHDEGHDLINVPEPKPERVKGWVGVQRIDVFSTLEEAQETYKYDDAVIPVDFEIGEGLK